MIDMCVCINVGTEKLLNIRPITNGLRNCRSVTMT